MNGSPARLPSAVFAQDKGDLLTGHDALLSARQAPERFEPNPKLRVDDGSVVLGAEVAVVDLLAAVLARVVLEAQRVASGGFEIPIRRGGGQQADAQMRRAESAP
ncbi:hypothetical protein [Dactylosporangium sp. NPDC049140]|uniref:hypothetical protein n=1 Tax=Dactylosporangium sp. NPDC049140 TaxID=3155647 RepID=UPI0034083259